MLKGLDTRAPEKQKHLRCWPSLGLVPMTWPAKAITNPPGPGCGPLPWRAKPQELGWRLWASLCLGLGAEVGWGPEVTRVRTETPDLHGDLSGCKRAPEGPQRT